MNRRDFIKMGTVAGTSGGLHAAERQVVYGNVQKRWDWTATNLRLVQKGHRIAWMDNDRVIFAGAEMENSEDTFGVYIWDFAAKSATKHVKLAWQDYDFAFADGHIAYRPLAPKKTDSQVPWMIGKAGEEKLAWIPWSELATSPLLWPANGPGQRLTIDRAAKRGYLWYALRPEHGRLEVSSGPAGTLLHERPDDAVSLVAPNGKRTELPISAKELFGVQDFYYSQCLGLYVVLPSYPRDVPYGTQLTGGEPRDAYLISPTGEVEIHRLPSARLVTYMEVTQGGFILASYAERPRDAGGWFQSNSGGLVKLFDYPLVAMGVSPNGRKLAYVINAPGRDETVVNVIEMISF